MQRTPRFLVNLLLFLFSPLFCLSLLLNGCSDDGASPQNNKDKEELSGFHIVSLDEDSVYWGDAVTVKLRNASSDSLRVFVDILEFSTDSVWDDEDGDKNLRFIVPKNSLSGKLRVFEHDTLLAKGDFSVEIFKPFANTQKSVIEGFSPYGVRPEDTVWIYGMYFPLRRQDVSVTLGNISLPIHSNSAYSIVVTLPPGARSDSLRVRMFNSVENLGILWVYKPGDSEFMEEGTMRYAGAWISDMFWKNTTSVAFRDSATVTTDRVDERGFEMWLTFAPFKRVPSSKDSVVFVADQLMDSKRIAVEVRMKREADSRISGMIAASYYKKSKDYDQLSTYEITIKNARWLKRMDSSYEIYSSLIETPNTLLGMKTVYTERLASKDRVETRVLDLSKPVTSFKLVLKP